MKVHPDWAGWPFTHSLPNNEPKKRHEFRAGICQCKPKLGVGMPASLSLRLNGTWYHRKYRGKFTGMPEYQMVTVHTPVRRKHVVIFPKQDMT